MKLTETGICVFHTTYTKLRALVPRLTRTIVGSQAGPGAEMNRSWFETINVLPRALPAF